MAKDCSICAETERNKRLARAILRPRRFTAISRDKLELAPLAFSLFCGFFFFSTTIFPAGGAPMRSRANSLTAVTARNRFAFFFLAMRVPFSCELLNPSVTVRPQLPVYKSYAQMCNNS